ncbi:MAG TPA: hypothetical protein DC017_04630 [Candidatus Wallbacteria bacterium]|nr:hypothetical protein [Candidatus Wallbacteria bacterium]
MGKITDQKLFLMLQDLSKRAKLEAYDFIDFLLKKRRKKKTDDLRKKILDVSIWSENDIKSIEKAKKGINKL